MVRDTQRSLSAWRVEGQIDWRIGWRAGPSRAGLCRLVACGLLGACAFLPACATSRKFHKHPAFVTESEAVAYLEQALEADSADVRRDAIVRISKTRYATRDVVLRGFSVIAETDPSSSVRCAAIGALQRGGDPSLAEPMLRILASDAQRDPNVLPADETVRCQAAQALGDLVQRGAASAEHEARIRETAIRLLQSDLSRDVRVCSARTLGYLPSPDVLEPLIAGLEQRDFGVVYECERSLMRLTGTTHDHDAEAWRKWLAATDAPFADAGRLDHQLDSRPKNWFARTWDSTRQTFASFRPKESG